MINFLRTTTGLVLTALLIGCAGQPRTAEPTTTLADIQHRIPDEWPLSLSKSAVEAEQGMVVTDAPLATQVGVDILKKGGNAVDAAVAVAFALAVVYPEAGNLGGGGFMVLYGPQGSAALDFRETAPQAAHRDMFLDEDGELTDLSVTGHLASGVPGAVAGLWEAHRNHGSLAWATLVEPAIQLAEQGFEIDEDFARMLQRQSNRLSRFPASAALFLPGGEPLQEGTQWRNPDLAATLRRIAERGPPGFYRGETADLIVAEMRRGDGIITHDDLAAYEPRWRDPIEFDYRGHRIISMPPASSGGITLALMANILEGYDLRSLGWHTPESVHLLAEAKRRAFADRNHYLGDMDFVDIPLDRLISKSYAAEQREGIDLEAATPSERVGPTVGAGDGQGDHTTHFSVVDRHGNAVALTTTINSLYGSAVTVAGAGFLLNNEMDDFTAKPGEPNQFGLVQGEANAIEPGKRMLSAMTPTIVMDQNGAPLLVTGARGGPRIISAVFQVISNVVDHEMDVVLAVGTPRIHHQHLPDAIFHEEHGLTPELAEALEARGHALRTIGVGVAPSIVRKGGKLTGIHDPRRAGAAGGH